jgi:hypothetical protein
LPLGPVELAYDAPMKHPAAAASSEPHVFRRLVILWLVGSLVWIAFIGALAWSEWGAYRRAAHDLDVTLTLKKELPEPPPPGFYLVEKSLASRDSLEHSATLLWFFGVIAIVPPAALLLLGVWGRRIGAL